jgi:hypothetical protein
MALTVAELKVWLAGLDSKYDNKYPVIYHSVSGRELSISDVEIDSEHDDVLISVESFEEE